MKGAGGAMPSEGPDVPDMADITDAAQLQAGGSSATLTRCRCPVADSGIKIK